MEKLFAGLKRLYLLVSSPAVVLFAICYFTADEPLVATQTCYVLLVGLYFVALMVVPISSFIFRRSVRKSEDLNETEQIPIIRKNYGIRIWALNGVSYLTGPIYLITLEEGCVYLFAIISVVVLLSYPTKQYLINK